jgi:hypothetical protein
MAMGLTTEQAEYIIEAKASFENTKQIYAAMTAPTFTETTGIPTLDVSFDSFFHTVSNHMRNKTNEGWPARITEIRRMRAEDMQQRIQYASLFERIKRLNDIANSPSASSTTKIAALKAIHDMMNEQDRNAAVREGGNTITISSERLAAARRFLN